jgi:hypothetical protein
LGWRTAKAVDAPGGLSGERNASFQHSVHKNNEPKLTLRRANTSGRGGGPWQEEDYDVFDGDRSVGLIYQIDAHPGSEAWFWGRGVEAQLSGKKRYGREATREAAMGVQEPAQRPVRGLCEQKGSPLHPGYGPIAVGEAHR